jgi:nitroreductase
MSDYGHDIWAVDDQAFPRAAAPLVKLQFLLHYAVQAPSTHNTQPWRFKLQGQAVELYAEQSRTLPVTDPQGREAIISCGAALFYLRVALHYFGYSGIVTLFPAPHTPDLLARVRLGRRRVPTDEDRRLFQAMRDRHTTRLPFTGEAVPESLCGALHAAAQQEGVWLQLIADPPARQAIAELIAAGDRLQWADPRFRQEQAAWVHLPQEGHLDGIPSRNLGLGDLATYSAARTVRSFTIAEDQAGRDYLLAASAPLLGVITTAADRPLYWLVAGQALAHILLRATMAGLAASFLNQAIQVPALRPHLAEQLGQVGYVQVLLRLGRGPVVAPTPRRDACTVLV